MVQNELCESYEDLKIPLHGKERRSGEPVLAEITQLTHWMAIWATF